MRYAIVSETYPPEINGVALTVQGLEQGLRSRGHEVQLVRPRQSAQDTAAPHEILVRGAPLPRYPGLRLGLPATSRLIDAWKQPASRRSIRTEAARARTTRTIAIRR